MVRLFLTSFLLLLLAASASGQSQESDFDRLFGRALELQKAGDTLGAIETYKLALGFAPDRVDALSNLGAAYVRLGQYDDAIVQYKAALNVEPTNATVRLNLALAYYKSARPNEAIPALKVVLASEPDQTNAYLVLADCYLQTGQPTEVIALLEPRESMFKEDRAFAYLLGTALLQSGDDERGQRYVERVFGVGDSAEAHLLMGLAHLGHLDYPAARTELERALQLNPALPTASSLYGRSLLGLGDQEGAQRAFRTELKTNINDFEANLQLGYLRSHAQQFEEAQSYLGRAIAIRPKDLTARKGFATVRLQMGAVEEAARLFEEIVKEAPDLVDAHVQLATAYNRLKRKDDAQREREIVDRLNAEIQAKQPGAVAGSQSPPNVAAPAGASTPGEGPH